jgi:hypothetical protein
LTACWNKLIGPTGVFLVGHAGSWARHVSTFFIFFQKISKNIEKYRKIRKISKSHQKKFNYHQLRVLLFDAI